MKSYRCNQCGHEGPACDFHKEKLRRSGRSQLCKECCRDKQLKKNYGISASEYDSLFDLQQGKCAICRSEETIKRRGKLMKLAVDHDHATGKIRALLCANCNILLGRARDRVEVLERAITYLKRYREKPCE